LGSAHTTARILVTSLWNIVHPCQTAGC
jgi:hypothetical protein